MPSSPLKRCASPWNRRNPSDRQAILAVTKRHDGMAGAELMEAWLETAPHAFLRRPPARGKFKGFYTLIGSVRYQNGLRIDPVVARFMRDISESPLAAGQSAFSCAAGRQSGDSSAVQAACWLDIKRHYIWSGDRSYGEFMTLAEFDPTRPPPMRLALLHCLTVCRLATAPCKPQCSIWDRARPMAGCPGWRHELGVAPQDSLLDKAGQPLARERASSSR